MTEAKSINPNTNKLANLEVESLGKQGPTINFRLESDFSGLGYNDNLAVLSEAKIPSDALESHLTGSVKLGSESVFKIKSFKLGRDLIILNEILDPEGNSLFDVSISELSIDSDTGKNSPIFKQAINQILLKLPSLQIIIYKLQLDGLPLGQFKAKMDIESNDQENKINSIKISPMSIGNKLIGFEGQIDYEKNQTRFKMKNKKIDVLLSDLSRYFNQARFTENTRVKTEIDLTWQGYPWEFDLSQTQGEVSILGKKGTLMTDNGSFQSRLLNELTLKSITDRIGNLLFSRNLMEKFQSLNPFTMFDKGIDFDNMTLIFNIKSGQLFAQEVSLISDVLHIYLTGKADLQQKQLDFVANVKPDLMEVAPVLFGVINPALGALTWLSSQIFASEDNKKESVVKTSYTIQGNFDKPQISYQKSAPH